MSDVQADEPEPEHGEDPETHLLPNEERMRLLSPEAREELLELVQDWAGEKVGRFRERVEAMREERS